MFKNWTNRDWFWLLGFLIGVIILLVAGFYNSDEVELNFSIISSAVSIALALVAIFIAIKQEGDNQVVTRETSNALMKIRGKIETMDNKIDRLDPNAVTAPAETQLINEIGKIFKSEGDESSKLDEISKTVNEKFDDINNQLNKYYEHNNNFSNRHNYSYNYEITIDASSDVEKVDGFISDFLRQQGDMSLIDSLSGDTLKFWIQSDKLISDEKLQMLLMKYYYKLIEKKFFF